jgi:hypothetical protein
MPRVQGGVPRIAVQGVPVQVKVVLEPLPEFDHRPTGGNPEFDTSAYHSISYSLGKRLHDDLLFA